MLDCSKNRLDYGKLLMPPSGYQVDRAVATCFSADLRTLLSIPIALFYSQTLEGDFSEARLQLLKAIKSFSSKVKIYHQKGQLNRPEEISWLYAYLEDSLASILPGNAFSSFHPKVWITRFLPIDQHDDLAAKMRVIVMSRNLTFSRNWDIAAVLDGDVGRRIQPSNEPLADFVEWLHSQDPIEQFNGFLKDLRRAKFEIPYPFEAFAFHPMGIGGEHDNPVFTKACKRSLVMSPFLHAQTIQALQANTERDLYLFSEQHELSRLPLNLFEHCEAFHLDDLIIDGERAVSDGEGNLGIQQQNLHAKFFLFEQVGESQWFIGSANATKAAAERNVEFMLELTSRASSAGIQPRLKEWIGEEDGKSPFVRFQTDQAGVDDPEQSARDGEFRLFEYDLLKAKITAEIFPSENGTNHDLRVEINLKHVRPRVDLSAAVMPYNCELPRDPFLLIPGEKNTVVFQNIAPFELSRFLQFQIKSKRDGNIHRFLMLTNISGLPEDRLEDLFRRIINTRDKFFEYLRFLLSDDVRKEDLLSDLEEGNKLGADEWTGAMQFNIPIYEQLLVAASRSPKKLAEIDEVIRHLLKPAEGETCHIPPEFVEFWSSFQELIPPSKLKG